MGGRSKLDVSPAPTPGKEDDCDMAGAVIAMAGCVAAEPDWENAAEDAGWDRELEPLCEGDRGLKKEGEVALE
jgi:hypothetical protein